MTWWTPEAVAGFAATAGFAGDELVTAIAVALASSNGRDDATMDPVAGVSGERRGLWMIPVDTLDGDPDGRLWHPQVNADAARSLYMAAGSAWDWSGAFRVGAHRWKTLTAAQAALAPDLTPSPSPLPSSLAGRADLGVAGRTFTNITRR